MFDSSFIAGKLKVTPQILEFKSEQMKNSPKCTKLKPLSNFEAKLVKSWIEKALEEGIIELSYSSWRSAIFPVAKPTIWVDGQPVKQFRMVTPFYNLNPYINIRATPLPTVEDIRQELAGSRWFSTLDLRQAFFQIPLEKSYRKYTAFACTGSNLYQYKVLPMGCSASGAILQSAMTEVLRAHYFRDVIVYMDDILIYTKSTLDHHLQVLESIIDVLEKADARIKFRKVEIEKEEIKFLGMLVNRYGWKIAEKFNKAVRLAKNCSS